ncbi:MAG: 16S rRNA (cytosine(967)-C(5))-methyltransferase RsmB [Ruminococcaceae bacterium]|nr:16S rRNA (cytosine(967)-C(5))-methyltransferase RsmB [Oscillospiraceae bacterium]
MEPRKLAYDLLQRLEKNNQFSNIILDRALIDNGMSDADKGLATALLYGVTERRLTLDYQISRLSARPVEALDMSVLTALRLGLYQLIYMDRIPPHAAINETVSLCPKKTAGFVNAILRAYTRDPRLEYPSADVEPARFLSVRFSVCLPLAEKLVSDLGFDSTFSLLAGFESRKPETTVSVNTLKISRDELLKKIPDSTPTQYSEGGIHVRGSVRELYGFDDGLFFVQDEASQICVSAIGARPNETFIDTCSCPGSKSFGAAISMKNEGRILSFDLHEKKLPLIVSGAKRLGINIISTSACDGRHFLPELEGISDRVLCDVPCSGFGVLSKKPELRYKDPSESEALPDIQLAILENACRYLKSGGTLIYSTCTVLPKENEENVRRFLDRNRDFYLESFSVCGLDFKDGYMTLRPDIHGTDGFFLAKLKKR